MKNSMFYHFVVVICAALLAAMIVVTLRAPDDPVGPFLPPFRVVDGDTLASGDVRLRLFGIDAPERNQTCETGGAEWRCGQAAADGLARFARDRNLVCEAARKDKYRRIVVRCRIGRFDINAEMVRTGLALAYGDYEQEEADAARDKLGLWGSRFERPEAYRKALRKAKAQEGSLWEELSAWWAGDTDSEDDQHEAP